MIIQSRIRYRQTAVTLLLAFLLILFLLPLIQKGNTAWAKDIRDLVAHASDGDIVRVEQPFLAPMATFSEELIIDKSITITGDGSSSLLIERLELVVRDDGITIENFDFTHNTYGCYESGRECYDSRLLRAANVESLVVRNCIFRQNQIYALCGGLIFLKNCKNISFENCRFEKGYAIEGGLMFLNGCENVVFKDCSFEEGSSPSGGLVKIQDSKEISFENCSFNDGRSRSGGGIELVNVEDCLFKSCSFSNLIASENGGAGRIQRSKKITFNQCHITGNDAAPFRNILNDYFERVDNFYGYGGAFSIVHSDTTFRNTEFRGNISHQGGALVLSTSDVMIQGCNFSENESTAVWVVNESTRNIAELILLCLSRDIQGIIEKVTAMVLTKATVPEAIVFPWDPGPGLQGGEGGAIYSLKTDLDIRDSLFENNATEKEGGGIYLISTGSQTNTTQIENTLFFRNNAQKGGALANLASGVALDGCQFDENSADAVGGALYSTQNITVDSTSFNRNKAPMGGAVCTSAIVNQQIFHDCVFDTNIAADINRNGEGGAIYAHGATRNMDGDLIPLNDCRIRIDGCTFSGNAAQNGGSVAFSLLSADIIDSGFSENGALELGGGMYLRNGAEVNVIRCEFSGNEATTSGGAVHSDDSELHIKRTLFEKNRADGKGGAIADFNGNVKAQNSIFTGNSSGLSLGSALFLDGSKPSKIINCTLAANKEYQNTIRARNISVLTLTNNIITSNFKIENVAAQDVTWSSDSIVSASHNICAVSGPGNFEEDSGVFVDGLNGDLRLRCDFLWGGLGAMEKADNNAVNTVLDFAGNPRIADNDGDGVAIVDLGAYEQDHVKITFADAHPGETAHGHVDTTGIVDNQPVHQWIAAGASPDYNSIAVVPDSGWSHAGWETYQHVSVSASDPFFSGETLYATYASAPSATYDFAGRGYYDDGDKSTVWITDTCSPLMSPVETKIKTYSGYEFLGWSDHEGGSVIVLPASITASTTFYAVYAPVTVTLTVDPGLLDLVRDPSGDYAFGTRLNLLDPDMFALVPNSDYYHTGFLDHHGNQVDLNAFKLTEDTTITALYAQKPTGILTLSTNTINGVIDFQKAQASGFKEILPGSATKDNPSGDEQVLRLISPNPFNHFAGFQAENTGSDLTLTAQYCKPFYQLKLLKMPLPGLRTKAAASDVTALFLIEYGTEVDLSNYTLIPAPGYRFVGWVDAAGKTLTTVILTEDLEIFAVFEPIECALTLESSGNGVVETPLFMIFNSGETVMLSSFGTSPDDGYRFDHWEDASGNLVNESFIIHGNITITAVFTPVSHALTVIVDGHGTVSGSLPGDYPEGSEVPLFADLATPDAGYVLTGFTDESGAFIDSVLMNRSRQIKVSFEAQQYSLSLIAQAGGAIDGKLLRWFAPGTVVDLSQIQVLAQGGYEFTGWLDSDFKKITSIAIDTHKVVYAEFVAAQDIPTVNEWGAIFLVILLTGISIVRQRRAKLY